jgi:hypothetical protein
MVGFDPRIPPVTTSDVATNPGLDVVCAVRVAGSSKEKVTERAARAPRIRRLMKPPQEYQR